MAMAAVNGLYDVINLVCDDDDVLYAIQRHLAEEQEMNVRERVYVDIQGWRLLDGIAFKEHFRMPRHTFQKLIVVVGNHLTQSNRLLRVRTPLDTCLLMTVWIMANGDTFRSTAAQFGVSKGVVFYHYTYLIKAFRELARRYIKWPDAVERDRIKMQFEEKSGYPSVVGCVDGVHIDITAPLEQPQQYTNRHDRYSILVQAVADNNVQYRDVYAGQPGSVGDRRTFDRSPLKENLLRRQDVISNDEHILGDKAYPLLCQLMIPYINDGHLTNEQKNHNTILSSCRATVERSFALLMSKWRRMKLFHSSSVEYCIDHIVASFMLHNFIILDGEEAKGIDCNEAIPEGLQLADPQHVIYQRSAENGAFKREFIADYLFRVHRIILEP